MRSFLNDFKIMPASEKLLILAMALTVLSFFVQSALPPAVSAAESDSISAILENIIPSNTPVGRFFHDNLRKIGHFAEYGLLGIETALLLMLFVKRGMREFFISSVSALFIAFLDETFQIFSGRGASISDVWLDFSGFLALNIITSGIIIIFRNIKRKNI